MPRGLALALHLPRDPVHGLHRLQRVLAHRGLGREHDGVGAVQDGIGHVGRLGPGGPGRVDHRLQHLGGGDHRLAVQARLADDLLLDQGHFLERELHPEIAARHHDGVRRVQDAAQILERGVLLDLGDQLHPPWHQRAQLLQVLRPAHEGERDVVDAQRHRLLDVLDVLLGQRWRADLDAGQIHPLVGLELAAVVDHRLDPLLVNRANLERQQAVVQQNPGADPHVLREIVVGGGNLSRLRRLLRREDDPLARLQPDRLGRGRRSGCGDPAGRAEPLPPPADPAARRGADGSTAPGSPGVPWEALMRTTSTPASSSAVICAGCSQAGPRVATILVRRIGVRSMAGV